MYYILLYNTKYYDTHLTVKWPEINQVFGKCIFVQFTCYFSIIINSLNKYTNT